MKISPEIFFQINFPKNGDIYSIGNDVPVDFTTRQDSGFGYLAKIEFSDDGGISWVTLAENEECFDPARPFGNYERCFTLSQGSPSDRWRVRITSVSNPAVSQTSDFFTVIPE